MRLYAYRVRQSYFSKNRTTRNLDLTHAQLVKSVIEVTETGKQYKVAKIIEGDCSRHIIFKVNIGRLDSSKLLFLLEDNEAEAGRIFAEYYKKEYQLAVKIAAQLEDTVIQMELLSKAGDTSDVNG